MHVEFVLGKALDVQQGEGVMTLMTFKGKRVGWQECVGSQCNFGKKFES